MSLQIPSPSRPVSVAVQSTSPPSRRQNTQHRASHQVASSSTPEADHATTTYTDVYSHPAAIAFAAAHPRRTIPKFGPYLLLQTLGEGEFGKVKLGLHSQWGEEVAVKLIRRGNVDSAVRMTKVEREIEVLRTLKHPNIVRLYDVIETDKYIGIIIEYASGGELFDHILAHRYLRERDASKLFSQLISGVWYIHQKKIVHRDLKLENLLLDRHRNVIITDFGFANRFEHRADDLMQTSCGSPCYAAPELVISEGLYVGSAVDIWSCGVILYAMLAGYLPFDDDPANPDGDNINLLYKYIVNTPLSFPEYISEEARDLLKMMLVPDPRKRASLESVMRHPWLAAYHVPPTSDAPAAFGRTVEELERAAMEQHQMKRLAYQRQMRAATGTSPVARAHTQTQSQNQHQNQSPSQPQRSRTAQPEFLYDSASAGLGYNVEDDDDPFGPAPGAGARRPAERELEEGEARGEPRRAGEGGVVVESPRKGKEVQQKEGEKEGERTVDKFRHTIQVEYDERRGAGERRRERSASGGRERRGPASPGGQQEKQRTPRQSPVRAAPASPVAASPPATVSPAVSAVNGSGGAMDGVEVPVSASTSGSVAERRERRRRGSHSSGTGAKPLPPSPTSPPTTWKMHSPTRNVVGPGEIVNGAVFERPAVMDVFADGETARETEKVVEKMEVDREKEQQAASEKAAKEKEKEKEGKKSRRNTLTGLTVMTNPISSIRANMSIRKKDTGDRAASVQLPPPTVKATPHTGGAEKTFAQQDAAAANASQTDVGGMQASTSKARKVMQWFRKGRDSITAGGMSATSPEAPPSRGSSAAGDPASPVQVFVTTPTSAQTQMPALSPIVAATLAGGARGQRTPSSASYADSSFAPTPTATSSLAARFRRSVNIGGSSATNGGGSGGSANRKGATPAAATAVAGVGSALRIHHGAVDQSTITTGQPPQVMEHVKEVLKGMGMETYKESEFKYRCIRAKQRRSGKSTIGSIGAGGQGVAAFTMVGSAGSNGVDKRGLPLPSQSSFSGGGMLRGLLMRRQSSQVSTSGLAAAGNTSFDGDDSLNNSGILTSEPASQLDTVYGDPSEDAGDEVRFSVELTRLDRLNDTYSLDIRRLKGNLRSYKFLYDTLRKRADLQQQR